MIVRQNPANVPEEKPVKACKDILKIFFLFLPPFNSLWAFLNRTAWSSSGIFKNRCDS